MEPLDVHSVPPDGGSSPGTIRLVEAVRELRGFPLGTILLRLGFVGEGPINEALAARLCAREADVARLERDIAERAEWLREAEARRNG